MFFMSPIFKLNRVSSFGRTTEKFDVNFIHCCLFLCTVQINLHLQLVLIKSYNLFYDNNKDLHWDSTYYHITIAVKLVRLLPFLQRDEGQ